MFSAYPCYVVICNAIIKMCCSDFYTWH